MRARSPASRTRSVRRSAIHCKGSIKGITSERDANVPRCWGHATWPRRSRKHRSKTLGPRRNPLGSTGCVVEFREKVYSAECEMWTFRNGFESTPLRTLRKRTAGPPKRRVVRLPQNSDCGGRLHQNNKVFFGFTKQTDQTVVVGTDGETPGSPSASSGKAAST